MAKFIPIGYAFIEEIKSETSVKTSKIMDVRTGCQYVLKSFDDPFNLSKDYEQSFISLYQNLAQIKYPVLQIPNNYYLYDKNNLKYPSIITKYINIGSLQDFFDLRRTQKAHWTNTDIYIVIIGIGLGINHLHKNKLAHGNLKPSNILLNNILYPQLSDYDFFKRSPEKTRQSYDIFCFAQIIYEFLYNKRSPIEISKIKGNYNQIFFNRCFSNDDSIIPSSEEFISYLSTTSFKNLIGEIDFNLVDNFLNSFINDDEILIIRGSFLYEQKLKKEALDVFKKAADNGNTNGMLHYGMMLEQKSDKKDEVIEYYLKAINQGNSTAMYRYYILNNESSEKSIFYLKKSSEKGNVDAMSLYAIYLMKNNDKKQAAYFMKKAADLGHLKSIFNYAKMLEKGEDGITMNINEAIKYYKKGIEMNDIKSINNYALILRNSSNIQDKKQAASYFKKAADQGNEYSMFNYAVMLFNGEGIEKNVDESIIYFKKAIDKGNVDAMIYYSTLIKSKQIQQTSNENTILYFKMFAEKGDFESIKKLILAFERNEITLTDNDVILNYYKIAADNGLTIAMLKYAEMLITSNNDNKKLDDINKYFKMAIDQGDIEAIYKYSLFLIDQKDIENAIQYLEIALNKSNKKAINKIILLFEQKLFIPNSVQKKIQYFKTACEIGNIYAMYKYARMLQKGKDIECNINEAASYYSMIITNEYDIEYKYYIEKHNIINKAMNFYFDLLDKFLVQPVNIAKEMQYYKQAAEMQNIQENDIINMNIHRNALFIYGKIMLEEFKNIEIGEKYLEKAIQLESSGALTNYAVNKLCLLTNDNIKEEDFESIRELFQKPIELGNVRSMMVYGTFLNEKSINEAEKHKGILLIKKAADLGYVEAMRKYACKLRKIDPKNEEIKIYTKKAADSGHVLSMYLYANILNKEEKDDQKIKEIEKYYLLASLKGFHKATYKYALMIEKREKTIENLNIVRLNLKLAADGGYIKAIYRYASILTKENNFEEAIKYYMEGANRGDVKSMYICGIFYENLDYNKAAHYFKLALDKKYTSAEWHYLNLILDGKYTPDNEDEYVNCIKRAMTLGLYHSTYRYSCLLRKGINGQINEEEANKYLYEAAIKEGDILAISDIQIQSLIKNNMTDNNYERFERDAKKYHQILVNYKNTGEKFVDDSFPPLENWKRIDEIYQAPLFKKDLIDPSFIIQGKIGNCYLISSLGRIARQYYLVTQLFERFLPNAILGEVENSINIKCGAVVVYFYAFGRKTPVIIDTFVPFKDDECLLSRPIDKTKSPWFCLVEKAYAKLNNSFGNIDGGSMTQALYSLFSYYSSDCNNLTIYQKLTFQKIMKYQQNGFVIDTFTPFSNEGLIGNHSYLVVKARTFEGKNFILLRNPWGDSEWSGNYSRRSSLSKGKLKGKLGYDSLKPGFFWMNDIDFFTFFKHFEILKPFHPEWHIKKCQYKVYAGVDFASPEAQLDKKQNYAFQVTEEILPDKKCVFHFLIERQRSKYYQRKNNEEEPLYYLIFSENNGKQISYRTKYLISTYKLSVKHNNIISMTIYRQTKVDYDEDFYLTISCNYQFKLYDIDHPEIIINDSNNPGIVFENFTNSYPGIAKLLKRKIINNQFVFSLENISISDADRNREKNISNIFEYSIEKLNLFRFDLSKFIPNRKFIGNGASGKIYLIKNKEDPTIIYAAKVYNFNWNISFKSFSKELTILRSIKCPSIINFIGFNEKDFDGNDVPTIITEYAKEGSLFSMLFNEINGTLNNNKWNNTKKMIVLIGVALGMEYLHHHNIIHRDLKLENIVLDDDLYPKICDFSDAKFLSNNTNQKNTRFVGTSIYMAPEVCNEKSTNSSYSYPIDVYSYGIMAYYIYANKIPPNNLSDEEIIARTISEIRPDLNCISPRLHNFVNSLWNKNQEERPTFDQIVSLLLYDKNSTWIQEPEKLDLKEIESYVRKFGKTMQKKDIKINLDIIQSINEENYPENAKKPKKTIQQILEDEMIPIEIKDNIKLAEQYLQETSNTEEIKNHLYNVGYQFYLGISESFYAIHEDLFYAIKYLKSAALLKHEKAAFLLATIFSNNSNKELQKIAFNIANISADLNYSEAFELIGIFYNNGVGVDKNIIMAAIYFRAAADLGIVQSMIRYADVLLFIANKNIEISKDMKKAEEIINNMNGKSSFIYNEATYTFEAIENENVALYVSEVYLKKASLKGSKEAIEKLNGFHSFSSCHAEYYDQLTGTITQDDSNIFYDPKK